MEVVGEVSIASAGASTSVVVIVGCIALVVCVDAARGSHSLTKPVANARLSAEMATNGRLRMTVYLIGCLRCQLCIFSCQAVAFNVRVFGVV